MQQYRFLSLLARKMAGEATRDELDELDYLMKEREDWKEMADMVTSPPDPVLTEAERSEAEALFAAHTVTMQLSGRFDKEAAVVKPLYIRFQKAIAIAASILLIASAYLIYNQWQTAGRTSDFSEIVTRKGNKSNIRLQDGTRVMMNSDTRISYGSDFGGSIREVKLSGEAFFDVAHNESKPFVIHTGNITIRVLGTAFNVKSYPQDGVVETSLIRGKIEITFNDRPNEKIILKPGEKLLVKTAYDLTTGQNSYKAEPHIELNTINLLEDSLVAETAWIKNKIIFDNDKLERIAKMLERKFDVVVEITDESIKNDTYTGIYQDEDLNTILQHMSQSKPFKFKIKGNKIIIQNNQIQKAE